jgi:hypothetical protein
MKQDNGRRRWTGLVLAALCVAMAALLAHGFFTTLAGPASRPPDGPAAAPRERPSGAQAGRESPRAVASADASADSAAAPAAGVWGATRGAM